jgi:hypothetical protein
LKDSIREGWDNSFRKMRDEGDDNLIDGEVLAAQTAFDEDEWEW